MTVEYIRGDLFQTDCRIIAHGCNAQGRMGSGVAKIIRDKFPEAYEKYRKVYEEDGLVLGSIVHAFCLRESGDKIIANCITQENHGNDGKNYVDYQALRHCFRTLRDYALRINENEFAMPMIGAGLGGGDWKKIAEILTEECEDVKVYVYYL